MLMIGNPTPDLEVEAFMPEGRFERLRLGALPAAGWSCSFIPRGLKPGAPP
ncbi:MAG: hypothetical protein ACREXM_03355 [Gammaproteobacteria bacterium]